MSDNKIGNVYLTPHRYVLYADGSTASSYLEADGTYVPTWRYPEYSKGKTVSERFEVEHQKVGNDLVRLPTQSIGIILKVGNAHPGNEIVMQLSDGSLLISKGVNKLNYLPVSGVLPRIGTSDFPEFLNPFFNINGDYILWSTGEGDKPYRAIGVVGTNKNSFAMYHSDNIGGPWTVKYTDPNITTFGEKVYSVKHSTIWALKEGVLHEGPLNSEDALVMVPVPVPSTLPIKKLGLCSDVENNQFVYLILGDNASTMFFIKELDKDNVWKEVALSIPLAGGVRQLRQLQDLSYVILSGSDIVYEGLTLDTLALRVSQAIYRPSHISLFFEDLVYIKDDRNLYKTIPSIYPQFTKIYQKLGLTVFDTSYLLGNLHVLKNLQDKKDYLMAWGGVLDFDATSFKLVRFTTYTWLSPHVQIPKVPPATIAGPAGSNFIQAGTTYKVLLDKKVQREV